MALIDLAASPQCVTRTEDHPQVSFQDFLGRGGAQHAKHAGLLLLLEKAYAVSSCTITSTSHKSDDYVNITLRPSKLMRSYKADRTCGLRSHIANLQL